MICLLQMLDKSKWTQQLPKILGSYKKPQLLSQLSTWKTMSSEKKVMGPCENNKQLVTVYLVKYL